MRTYPIRTNFGLPMVSAVVVGSRGSTRVELVFDSGAAYTQLHIGTLIAVGFSFDRRTPDLTVRGITGKQQGYSCNINRLHLLGQKYSQRSIAAFDFHDWAEDGIDGLLGWDLIEKLHFEMDGPHRILKVFVTTRPVSQKYAVHMVCLVGRPRRGRRGAFSERALPSTNPGIATPGE